MYIILGLLVFVLWCVIWHSLYVYYVNDSGFDFVCLVVSFFWLPTIPLVLMIRLMKWTGDIGRPIWGFIYGSS